MTKLVNSSGTVVVDYTYDAFGNQTSETEDSNPLRYAGEYWDSESGLIYLRARYYDSGVGAFVSEDPAKDGLNWYVYCSGNPVNHWDPSGMRYESLRQIAEDSGGKVKWDATKGAATVTLNGKSVEYYTGDGKGSFIDGTDGKMYVDGDAFAHDFGGSYTEISGEGYTGYIFIIDNKTANSGEELRVESIKIEYSVEGSEYAIALNAAYDEAGNIAIHGFTLLAGWLVGDGTGQILYGFVTAALGFIPTDFSFQLKAGERFTVITRSGYNVRGSRGFYNKYYQVRDRDGNFR